MSSESKVVVERPLRENGAERIYTASVKVDFLQFEMCFNVVYWSKWAVSSKNVIECDVKKKKKEDNMTPR